MVLKQQSFGFIACRVDKQQEEFLIIRMEFDTDTTVEIATFLTSGRNVPGSSVMMRIDDPENPKALVLQQLAPLSPTDPAAWAPGLRQNGVAADFQVEKGEDEKGQAVIIVEAWVRKAALTH